MKIRESAMFLGDMSEMHKRAISINFLNLSYRGNEIKC